MLVKPEFKKLLLNLREPERVTAIMPTAQQVDFNGHNIVVVPHRLDEVRVLRNIGIDAPSPIDYYYDWPIRPPFSPFAHQRITSAAATLAPRLFILNGLGSGKSLSVLWAYDYLRSLGVVKRALVMAPLSTLERTWGDEVFFNFPHLTHAVLHGSREHRHKLLDENNGVYDVYIINHDGIKNKETIELLIKRLDIDLIIVDELSAFRNHSTDRWKYANRLIQTREWAWGLTGTPIPNEPTDAWAQVRLINPSRVPKYKRQFQDMTMRQITTYKWVAKSDALDTVYGAMQPAVRFATKDCVDLPPTSLITRELPLTPEQDRAYKDMVNKLKAEYEGGQITAVNEAVKLGKLLQICCGVAYGKDGAENIILPAQPRLEETADLIRSAEGKAIVFVPYTGALTRVAEYLARYWSVRVVDGSTPKGQRDEIFGAFQRAPDPHVIVANAAAMSHGITLTEASLIVWFGPATSAEIFEQANARIVRPGQRRHTVIAMLESTPVERKRYEQLQGKVKNQGVLLDMFKGATRD